MTIDFIAYGVFVYFLGLIFSGCFSLIKGQWKKSAQLFVLINTAGFLIGALYLSNFAPRQIVMANFAWLFQFSPTINFLSAVFFTLISGVSALVGVYSIRYLELYEDTYNPKVTQFLTVVFVLGMQGVLFANNAFSFLFFWELMSIASFFLVFADKTKESIRAAFLYFIMTHLGASAILGGFLILSGGSLLFNLSNITSASADLSPALATSAFALFLFGFGSKAGLIPFHVWLPEAHPQAPSNISALMSGLMLKIAVYGFIMVTLNFVYVPAWIGLLIIFLGLLSGIVGALSAAIKRDLKRAFAYSSIENMGIIFTMIGLSIYLLSFRLGGEISSAAYAIIAFAIFHAISHAIFKTALFMSSGVVISRLHSKSMDTMGGLAKIMPLFSFAFLLVILGSLPLPPFGTFYGEWGFIQNLIGLMHQSALGSNTIALLLLVLSFIGLIGGLAVFAMVRIFGISMLGRARSSHVEMRDEKTDYLLIIPILILGFSILALGIFAKPILSTLMVQLPFIMAPENYFMPQGVKISSITVFIAIIFFLVITFVLKKLLVRKQTQREYHTWDCGQPIDATMEYTASAFSAPIRFFFLKIVARDKVLWSKPIAQSNPWIRSYTFSLSIKSVWKNVVYRPIALLLIAWAEKLKVIQGGRIQYYLLFLLFTLIITLIFAL